MRCFSVLLLLLLLLLSSSSALLHVSNVEKFLRQNWCESVYITLAAQQHKLHIHQQHNNQQWENEWMNERHKIFVALSLVRCLFRSVSLSVCFVLRSPFFRQRLVFFFSLFLYVQIRLFSGLITTTARKLDRENQSEHILEVCILYSILLLCHF